MDKVTLPQRTIISMPTWVYVCPACFKVVERSRSELDYPSYCDQTGKDVILHLLGKL